MSEPAMTTAPVSSGTLRSPARATLALALPPPSRFGDARQPRAVLARRLLRHHGAMVGGALLALLVGLALLGPLLSAYDPTRLSQAQQMLPPSAANLMGTDNFGRDIWTRLLYGGRISLQVGVTAVGIGALAGLAVGVPSGYFGSWYDLIIQRVVDVMQAFPGLLLALALVAMIGPSLNNAMLAVGIAGIPGFARVARAAVMATTPLQYVEAARLIGAGHTRIIVRHVLPNIMAPLIVLATTGIGTSIAATGALGFLGMGAQPPTPEWGTMLAEGRLFLRVAWWMGAFPGLAIALIVLAVNLLGDGLRDALDPRLRI
jgi:peptide/nickel transport system permease protein